MTHKLPIVLIFVLTVSCGKTNPEPKSVAYFLEHPEERTELIRKANSNPGKYKDDPEVINAIEAKHQAFWKPAQKGQPAEVNPKLDTLH